MTSRVLFRAERLLAAGAAAGPVLGLETGTPTASLALIEQGRLLAEMSRSVESHGATLPAMVEELLARAGLGLERVAAVAVGIGPGSFTGLRIGLAYAKGLAWAGGRAIIGIPSLDSLALCACEHPASRLGAIICPVLDARKGELYAALYRMTSSGLERLSDAVVVSPEQLTRALGGEVVFVGEAVKIYGRALVHALGSRATLLGPDDVPSRGMLVAALGAARVAHRDLDSVLSLQPTYVRSPEAALKARAAGSGTTAGTEGVWSEEKRSLFSAMRPMMRN